MANNLQNLTPKLLSARQRVTAALQQTKQNPFTAQMLAAVSASAKDPKQKKMKQIPKLPTQTGDL